MKFEIIKNSESKTGYDIADNEYMGQTCNLNGWSFELAKADGTICYSEVKYTSMTPEDYLNSRESEYLRMCLHWNDLTMTGRVVFRGYYEEYEDLFDGKWEQFVREVPFDMGDLLYVDDDAEADAYDDAYDYLYDLV